MPAPKKTDHLPGAAALGGQLDGVAIRRIPVPVEVLSETEHVESWVQPDGPEIETGGRTEDDAHDSGQRVDLIFGEVGLRTELDRPTQGLRSEGVAGQHDARELLGEPLEEREPVDAHQIEDRRGKSARLQSRGRRLMRREPFDLHAGVRVEEVLDELENLRFIVNNADSRHLCRHAYLSCLAAPSASQTPLHTSQRARIPQAGRWMGWPPRRRFRAGGCHAFWVGSCRAWCGGARGLRSASGGCRGPRSPRPGTRDGPP